ncbi:unnamed protein product [Prunus armeniaca]
MKLSEEVDGQVTREWRSCESDQGGSSAIGSLTDDLGYFCLPLWKGNQYEKEEEERYKGRRGRSRARALPQTEVVEFLWAGEHGVDKLVS